MTQQNSEGAKTPATLTVDEAHALIGKDKISRGGFYAAINRREVPHLRLGHRILIPRHAFTRWLESSGPVISEDLNRNVRHKPHTAITGIWAPAHI